MPENENPKIRRELPETPPPPVDPSFVELCALTNFSFLRGASHPDEMAWQAAQLGYGAIGIADINTLAGVVRAHVEAKKWNVKPIIGARLVLSDAPQVILWAPTRAGYASLCRLLTLGKRRAPKGECHLTLADVCAAGKEGTLLAAMVPGDDLVNYDVREPLHALRDAFGEPLSIAACHDCTADPARRIELLAALSRTTRVPLLATNDVHYHHPSRRQLQDVLTCVRHGCTITEAGYRLFPNGERYLKSPAQMRHIWRDHPNAIARSVELAGRCTFDMSQLKYEYPEELVPAGVSPIQHLRLLVADGTTRRYPDGLPEKVRGIIEHELKLIEQVKFEHYFLTVHDIVQFARSQGILCQGRGSAANSAVCYCLEVTSIDPDKTEVLFERFVSAERGEPPDIDIDFEHERREEVIQYVYRKYGRDRAGMTAEVISYRGRSAVRDVGKALGFSLDQLGVMAKQLDWWHKGTVSAEQIRAAGIDPNDRKVLQLMILSRDLLGFPRHLSQHVGGMVITHGPLGELVPIENGAMPDRTVIEWDKESIEGLAILKVDLLGLGMLTCISKTLALINGGGTPADRQPPIEPHIIARENDPRVYAMICAADTVGVFQIESRAQMTMLPRLRPREYYDLVIEVAIVRPGPIQGKMVHPYLKARERQLREPGYCGDAPHPALREVLKRTLGVPLFQEQAMKVVMVAAGFTGDEANAYRKAMAAWKAGGAVHKFEQRIIDGMTANGYELEFAQRLCEQLRGFGSYGFPESHAASFGLLVYISSWLKRYYPAAFAAGLLNSQPMGFYAPAQIVRDAQEHAVDVRAVDVNASAWDCTLECDDARRIDETTTIPRTAVGVCGAKPPFGANGPALRLGFRMVKGLSVEELTRLIRARQRNGPFTSIDDLQRRARLAAATIDRLAEADAFGSIDRSRRVATWDALALDDANRTLFDAEVPSSTDGATLPQMSIGEEVFADYATARLSLKAHPIALMRDELRRRGVITSAQIAKRFRGYVTVAGIVLIRQRPGTASGVVFITIEDETGVVNLIVRPHIFDRYLAAARHARILEVDGIVERQGAVVHVTAQRMRDVTAELTTADLFRSRDFH